MKYKLIEFSCYSEIDGTLTVLEEGREIPFDIKRMFYISNVPDGCFRAEHACMNADVMIIAINGSAAVCMNDGCSSWEIILDDSKKGIIIPCGIWMLVKDFEPNTILLILSNKRYSECNYVENYDEYLNLIKGEGDC